MTRVCAHCGGPLVRRQGERECKWVRRRCCSTHCARMLGGEARRMNALNAACSIEACDAPARARGLCWAHYKRDRRTIISGPTHPAGTAPAPGWDDQAPCRGQLDVFFPTARGRGIEPAWDTARAICTACPLRDQCLEWVLSWEFPSERYGMFAGLTPRERSEVARKRAA